MLRVGLTGGIGAGKSTVSARLAQQGAVLVDGDRIAREVVEPGTPGLEAVVEAFGAQVLTAEGTLDRPSLGSRVFGDAAARHTLNGILHPLIAARAAEAMAAAPASAVVLHDMPLLVENRMGAAYHLVVVVHTPVDERVARLVAQRGMTEADAWARVGAQASDAERRAAADVWLDNSGAPESVLAVVDALWHERLVPYERHVRERSWRRHRPVLVPADPTWPVQAQRLAARLRLVLGDAALRVDHVGATAVPGLDATDVLDLQVTVRGLEEVDPLADALGEAGFPRHLPAQDLRDPAGWAERLHVHADPGRPATVHLRVAGSPGQRSALLVRDWLRAQPEVAAEYLSAARATEVAAGEVGDPLEAREPWFEEAYPRALTWAELTGWSPS